MFKRRVVRSRKEKSKEMDKSKGGEKPKQRVEKSKKRVDKSAKKKKHSSKTTATATTLDQKNLAKLQKSLSEQQQTQQTQQQTQQTQQQQQQQKSRIDTSSPIVTLHVGPQGRLFAAHEHVLRQSPFLDAACRSFSPKEEMRKISLRDEEPEVFSAILEYLYTGDYYPRLLHDKRHKLWELEDKVVPTTSQPSPRPDAIVFLSSVGAAILRDTVIYCAAERYGLGELKRLALRKQGLQSGIDVVTILKSAQYAYDNTPDSDSRLRAHYLALIIRCRKTFKRSGTMQAEMGAGGSKLFFDLFVALCDHLDDVMDAPVPRGRSPK